MSGPDFLDANILIYAYDPIDARKQKVSRDLLRKALAGGTVWSAQVLAEFAATLLHKMIPPANPEHVKAVLNTLAPVPVVRQDEQLVRRAVEAHAAYGIHFWDGMIVAAAERAACGRILSEDFNPGQTYFGVIVENPFRSPYTRAKP
jgi:predicted nucleic acid-binding protein